MDVEFALEIGARVRIEGVEIIGTVIGLWLDDGLQARIHVRYRDQVGAMHETWVRSQDVAKAAG